MGGNLDKSFGAPHEPDAVALLLARLHEHGGNLTGCARQPDRRGRDRLRQARRLARSAALRRPDLRPAERAAHGGASPGRPFTTRPSGSRSPSDRRLRRGSRRFPPPSRPSSAPSGATCAGSRCRHPRKGRPLDPGPPPIGVPSSASTQRAAIDVIRATAGRTALVVRLHTPEMERRRRLPPGRSERRRPARARREGSTSRSTAH